MGAPFLFASPLWPKKGEECAPALDSCLECSDVQAFRIKPWKKSSPWDLCVVKPWLVSLREKATRDPVWPPFPSQNFFQLSKAALLLARPSGAGSVYSSSHWLSKSDSEKQRSVASNTVDGTFKPFRCQARHRSIQSLRMAGSSCSTMVLTRCLSGFSGWKSKGKTSKRLLKEPPPLASLGRDAIESSRGSCFPSLRISGSMENGHWRGEQCSFFANQ